MLGGVFISYRREDSAGFARLIYDRLTHKLGHDSVFFDVDNIAPGLDFFDVLSEKLSLCDALVAVIGKNWNSSTEVDRRRLDDPDDFVRIEIEAALQRGIRVIPVLVDGATMPSRGDLPESLQKLHRRQAIEISHNRFDSDVERLTHALSLIEEELRQQEAPAKSAAVIAPSVQRSTRDLFELAIGRDAYAAACAAVEIANRSITDIKESFNSEWAIAPCSMVAENFLRDTLSRLGDGIAHHLVDVLEQGAKKGSPAAVNVARFAFPKVKGNTHGSPGGRLFSWIDGDGDNYYDNNMIMVNPILAVGSAGIDVYSYDVVKRANKRIKDICGETLIRLLVQAESRLDAEHSLEQMEKLVAIAHHHGWPNPDFLLVTFPAWSLSTAAQDVLVDRGLNINRPEEIQTFAATALQRSSHRQVASALARLAERGKADVSKVCSLLAYLGGEEAARVVAALSATSRDLAMILPWKTEGPDGKDIERFLEDKYANFLVYRALGIVGSEKSFDRIEEGLSASNFLIRGYAALGLAYARGTAARPDLEQTLNNVSGPGDEAVRERILLCSALVHAGALQFGEQLLSLLPLHVEHLGEDLAKHDILAALARRFGEGDLKVRAWRRVAWAPAGGFDLPTRRPSAVGGS